MYFKRFTLIAFAFLVSLNFTFAQEREELVISSKDSIISSSWILGIGTNIVDDSGDAFDALFDIKETWHAVPYPSRVSIGRYFKSGLGVEAIASYNTYKAGKRVDGLILNEDKTYYAIDTRLSYDLNKLVGQTGFFDPYVGVGVGYTQANDQGRGTYNAVIGFRTWFSDRFGLDFSSSGKWRMNTNATNHLQHAVGLVYQFGIEKELSSKGKDKLALLEALEAEQNRRNDSIAQAQSVQQAKLLAAQIAQEQEQKQLAEAAQEKLRNERDALENDINALGNVYFDLNSSYLTSAAKLILTKLVQLLEDKPQVKLQVSSFTDSRGAENYNTWLSERRAQRTIDYLVQKGIEGDRLIPNAAGENGLLNECDDQTYCTESKHKINRRSEFKVLYK